MDQTLYSSIAFIAAFIVSAVDGRRAVSWSLIAAGVGLAGTAASAAGLDGALLLVGAVVCGGILERVAEWLVRSRWQSSAQDPLREFRSVQEKLFGPRSQRVIAAAIAVPAASWVSFNIPVGSVANIEGVLFASCILWLCGIFRLVLARTIEDVCAGTGVVLLATAVGWLERTGQSGLPEYVVLLVSTAGIALLAGILNGRYLHHVDQGVEHA
ncbi:MAG: hypothetical protein ACP5OR_03515 [Candidatus Dormibacteria bacterium]